MFTEFSLGCKGMSSSLIRKERIINQNDHSFTFVVTLVIPCHSLSFFVTPCLLFQHSYHSFYHLLPFVITHPHWYHSLSLVVTHCHWLYDSFSLAVTPYHSMCHSSVFLQTIKGIFRKYHRLN